MNRKIAFIAHSIASLDVRCRAKSAPPVYKQKSFDKCDADTKTDDMKCELIEKCIMLEKVQRDTCELRNKIENMRIEWRSQQEHLGKLHQEYVELQHTLGQHSVYCATLGATMGSILWKVSRLDGTVESMLEGTRMSELITIMDNSLKAFLEVFASDLPDPCTNEYQFVLAWCGILTNVSACPDGRYFLSTKSEGQQLVNHLVRALPKFTTSNGFLLQRTILMIIYNLVINTNGMELMQCNVKLTPILSDLMMAGDGNKQPEIQDLVMKLIVSLTQTIPSVQYMEHLRDTLPMRLIETIAGGDENAPNVDSAQKILRNFERNEKLIRSQLYMKGDDGVKSTKQYGKKYHCKRHCKKTTCKANQ